MQISSVSNGAAPSARAMAPLAKIKQAFDDLDSAVTSGNLTDAKQALAQVKQNAPQQSEEKNPIATKMEALSQAVESGDVQAAQEAYADVKKALAQKPAASGGKTGGPSGPPPGGQPPSGGKGAASTGSSSSNKVYDKMDANQDGTVSFEEKLAYELEHPENTKESAVQKGIDQGYLDATA